MKHIVFILSFFLISTAIYAQVPENVTGGNTGTIVGGAGFLKFTGGNPNAINSIKVIDERQMASFAWDTTTNRLWQYKRTLAVGKRWKLAQFVEYSNGTPTTTSRDTAYKWVVDTFNRKGYICNSSGCVEIGAGATPAVNNGLSIGSGNEIQLGGILNKSTTIFTDATNTLKIRGLQSAIAGDSVLMIDPFTGQLKRKDAASFGSGGSGSGLIVNSVDSIYLKKNGIAASDFSQHAIDTIQKTSIPIETDFGLIGQCQGVLDTLDVGFISNGIVNQKDNSFPNLIRTKTGKIFCSYRRGTDHVTHGIPVYRTSLDNGRTWSNEFLVETDSVINYMGCILSYINDTIFMQYGTNAQTLYLRYSVDDGVTWSSRVAIASNAYTETKILKFKNIYFQNYYNFAAATINMLYTSNPLGTWSSATISSASTSLLPTEVALITYKDSLILFFRSDNIDTLYRTASIDGFNWSTAIKVNVPEWHAGKPDVLRLDDGRLLLCYRGRETPNALPDRGMVAMSNDNGLTFSILYRMINQTFVYSSTLYLGDDIYLNANAAQLSANAPYATIFREYFIIPKCPNTSANVESSGAPYSLLKTYWNNKILGVVGDSVSNRFLKLNPTALQTVSGTTIFNGTSTFSGFSNFAGTSTFTTGASLVVQAGVTAASNSLFSFNTGARIVGEALVSGSNLLRVESSAASSPPTSAGVGVEIFKAGTSGYIQTWNATTSGYGGLSFRASAFTLLNGIGTGATTDRILTNASGVIRDLTIAQVLQSDMLNVVPQGELTSPTPATTTQSYTVTISPAMPTGTDFSRIEIYFNGMRQRRGTGKDYTITSSTTTNVTFDFFATVGEPVTINDIFFVEVK